MARIFSLGIVFRNIYLYRNQNRKKAAEDIYFRTDHHWTPLGAYYAAQKFAEVANLDFKDLSDYQKNDIEGFVGTMYAFSALGDNAEKLEILRTQ